MCKFLNVSCHFHGNGSLIIKLHNRIMDLLVHVCKD